MIRLSLPLFLFTSLLEAATCCLGGGPKSFISLQRLEKYQVGLTTGYRGVFAHYNVYGELEETSKNQSVSAALGAGVRILDPLQISATLPVVYQENQAGRTLSTRTNVGDIFVGSQYTILESLFQSDPYPTVSILAGLKVPTGALESSTNGNVRGTGNGLWEPSVGFLLQKNYSFLAGSFRGAFTKRIPKSGVLDREGDLFELNESLAVNITQQFSLLAGLSQAWTRAGFQGGKEVAETHTRTISGLLSSTYFFTRFASATLSLESVLPVESWGMNSQAYRSISLTTRYGFY